MVKRGQLYRFDFGTPRGSEPGYSRPVLIIQDDDFNATNIGTVIIAVVTTSLRLAKMDGNVLLEPKKNGVKELSVVNVTQLYTVDKIELGDLLGTVTQEEMRRVNEGLKLVLSLDLL
jgi:mRNA interferase MazF